MRIKDRQIRTSDKIYYQLHKLLGWGVVLILLLMVFTIGKMSIPAFQKFGVSFAFSEIWNASKHTFGALPFIYGTFMSSLVALLFAVPMSVCVAVYITELAAPRWGRIVGFLVEMLAAIPSIVFGMWGLFVLVPVMRTWVQPFLLNYFSWIPFFSGPPFGLGLLTAGLVLSFMIMPTITAVCREVFRTVSRVQKEAALGLGATRWEMIRLSVLKASKPGIIGASILGLGRALGETMAVTMVIGNVPKIKLSLFEPAQTMASLLANQYAEAEGDLHLSALTAVGFLLFVMALIVNLIARWIVWKVRAQR